MFVGVVGGFGTVLLFVVVFSLISGFQDAGAERERSRAARGQSASEIAAGRARSRLRRQARLDRGEVAIPGAVLEEPDPIERVTVLSDGSGSV
jgi:hypothetical protein